jgi:sigma-54-specific transcriptional regulator
MPLVSLPDPTAQAIASNALAHACTFVDRRSRLLYERLQLIAPSDATTLISGESGTGKERIARLVHAFSGRRGKPFVAVNCGAFSESLIESELFGHERGAFSGASEARAGWFEAANGGTLLLDEIGDLAPRIQIKLLRVLQEQEVVRVGARHPVPVDVRVIAASNVDLPAAVRAGRFREDLYYRLNVASLNVLPLRERTDDIEPLARHFVATLSARLGIDAPTLDDDALRRLRAHLWPGNIRELENVIHHALLVNPASHIGAADLRLSVSQPAVAAGAAGANATATADSLDEAIDALVRSGRHNLLEHIEERLYRIAYEHARGNQVQTARIVGLNRNVVHARLVQWGLLAAAGTDQAAVGTPINASATG